MQEEYRCSTCCEIAQLKSGPYHDRLSGLSNVFLHDIETAHCNHCGNADIIMPYIIRINRAIALVVLASPSRLTGPQLKLFRWHAQKSQQDFRQFIAEDEVVSPHALDDSDLRVTAKTDPNTGLMEFDSELVSSSKYGGGLFCNLETGGNTGSSTTTAMLALLIHELAHTPGHHTTDLNIAGALDAAGINKGLLDVVRVGNSAAITSVVTADCLK